MNKTLWFLKYILVQFLAVKISRQAAAPKPCRTIENIKKRYLYSDCFRKIYQREDPMEGIPKNIG